MYDFYFYLLNVILAGIGFYIAYYVGKKKTTGEAMTCSIEHNCEGVVSSKYGKTFGIENALLGAIYYLAIGVAYAILLFTDFSFLYYSWSFWVMIASVGAAVFSLYLLSIMAFVLKEWCDWCIGSAVVSIAIAIVGALVWYL